MGNVYTRVSILLCLNLGVGVWYMGNVFILIWGWCLVLGIFLMFISSGGHVVGNILQNYYCCLLFATFCACAYFCNVLRQRVFLVVGVVVIFFVIVEVLLEG